MDADSKRFLSTLRSRSEILMSFEEIDGDDDYYLACPFCEESYDIITLCCHIDDEHTIESKNSLCPVCSVKVGVDMVSHLTHHHGSLFKRKRKLQPRTNSTLSFLRKELKEGDLQKLLGGFHSRIGSTTNVVTPDPLLSSFVGPTRSHVPRQVKNVSSLEKPVERKSKQVEVVSRVSTKEREEQTKRSEFIQKLFTSAILDEV